MINTPNHILQRCKFCNANNPAVKYKLRSKLQVLMCASCGAHYTNQLDGILSGGATESIAGRSITQEEYCYIDTQLQSNLGRYTSKSRLVSKYTSPDHIRLLDVGAGGGLFLSLMRVSGATVFGIEPNPTRITFAHERYGLDLCSQTIEEPYWQDNYKAYFDVITMWDVIEHVDSPVQLLENAYNLLKPGGFLCIDTPARDGFYYRIGQATYSLTGGRFPTFLNAMYTDERCGHKQILATRQLADLLVNRGLQIVDMEKCHELSFPYKFYLKRLLKSQGVASVIEPFVAAFFFISRIKNKMLLVARKKKQ